MMSTPLMGDYKRKEEANIKGRRKTLGKRRETLRKKGHRPEKRELQWKEKEG